MTSIIFIDKNIPQIDILKQSICVEYYDFDIRTNIDLSLINRIGFIWENNYSLFPFGSTQYKLPNDKFSCFFSNELIEFFQLFTNNIIIDLITCELNSQNFKDELNLILNIIPNITINYSVNLTGNPPYGDWIMESSGINIAPIYFNSYIENFTSVLLNAGDIFPSTGSVYLDFNNLYTYQSNTSSSFLDITTYGTPTTIFNSNNDDSLSSAINIGFNFKLKGQIYSQFRISTNGILFFGNIGISYTVAPSFVYYYPCLMFLGNDLITISNGIRYVLTTDFLLIDNKLKKYSSTSIYNIQIFLYKSGKIEIKYNTTNSGYSGYVALCFSSSNYNCLNNSNKFVYNSDVGVLDSNLNNKTITYNLLTDLSGVDLSGFDLSGVDLSGVNLTNVNLTNVNLTNVNLTNTDLSNTTLLGLQSSNIKGTPKNIPNDYKLISGYIFGPGVNLSNKDLSGFDLSNSNLTNTNLTNAVLTNTDLTNTDLSNTTLVRLQSGNIIGTPKNIPDNYKFISGYIIGPSVNLINKDLSGIDLSGFDLSGVNLTNVNLTNTILTNTDLSNTTLLGLQSGNIIGTPKNIPDNYKLISGYIIGPSVNLSNKDLSGIDLSNSDLRNAVLINTVLTNTDLSNSTLLGLQSGNIIGIPKNIPDNYKLISGYIFGPSVNLSNKDLSNIDLLGIDLSNSNLTNAILTNVNLAYTVLTNTDLSNTTLVGLQSNNIIGIPKKIPNNYKLISGYIFGPSVNLSNKDLSNIDLSGIDLSNSNLTNAILTNTILTNTTLINTDLSNTTLIGLQSGNIKGTPTNIPDNYKLISGYIIGPSVNLSNKDLSGIDLSNSNLIKAILTNTVLTNTVITNTDLSNTTLIGLQSGNIKGTPTNIPDNYKLISGYIIGPGVNLSNKDLSGIDLSNSILTNAILTNVVLTKTDLTNTDLSNTTLVGLQSDNIIGIPKNIPNNYKLISGYIFGPSVNLSNKDLSGFDLSNVNLTNANLTNANLTNVNLINATLTNTKLLNSTLTGVISSNITGTPINIPYNYRLISNSIILITLKSNINLTTFVSSANDYIFTTSTISNKWINPNITSMEILNTSNNLTSVFDISFNFKLGTKIYSKFRANSFGLLFLNTGTSTSFGTNISNTAGIGGLVNNSQGDWATLAPFWIASYFSKTIRCLRTLPNELWVQWDYAFAAGKSASIQVHLDNRNGTNHINYYYSRNAFNTNVSHVIGVFINNSSYYTFNNTANYFINNYLGNITNSSTALPTDFAFKIINKSNNLSNIDFTNISLTNIDLSGFDLSNSNLTNAILTNAVLTNTDLTNTDLSNTTLIGLQSGNIIGTPKNIPNDYKLISGYIIGPSVILINKDLSGFDLSGFDLLGVNLTNTDLTNTDLTNTDLTNTDLSNTTLLGLQSGNIIGVPKNIPNNYKLLNGYIFGPSINIFNVNLNNTDLSNTNLTNSNLINADLTNSNLMNTDLTNSNLMNADLTNSNLMNTNLTNSNLMNADLTNSNLMNTNLTNSNLMNADLTDSYLVKASLIDASTSGTIFMKNNLFCANMKNVSSRNNIIKYVYYINTDMTNSDFTGTVFIKCCFINVDLSSVIFDNCTFDSCGFYGCNQIPIPSATIIMNNTIIQN